MPLSDHEQQLLEQMEQALHAEDPKFATHMQGALGRSAARRRYIVGALGLVVGLGLVLVGVSTSMWVGAAGFAIMVAAGAYALTPPRRKAQLGTVHQDGSVRVTGTSKSPRAQKGPSKTPKTSGPSRPASHGTFMQRLEERWERRRRGGH